MLNINKASKTICNGICHKSQQLQLVEIRKIVSVDPAWNILTCASQNMDEEMLKLVAVKIIQTLYTANEEAVQVLKSILLVSLDNTSTLLFILDNSGPKLGNCWLVLLFVFPAFVHKEFQWTRSGQAPSQVGFNSFICHTVTLQLVEKSVQISSHLLICVWTFFFFIKSSMASRLWPLPDSVFAFIDVSRSSG